jgi:hypothetical protein
MGEKHVECCVEVEWLKALPKIYTGSDTLISVPLPGAEES